MDVFKVEVCDPDVAENVRREAAAHGHSVEEEIASVVDRAFRRIDDTPVALVDRLIAIVGDDNEMYLPPRDLMEQEPVFVHDDFS